MLSDYKDIFGAPGSGAHSYRMLGFAAVDVIMTILVIALTAYLLIHYNVLSTTVAIIVSVVSWTLLFIFLHYIFGVKTRLNIILGLA